MLSIRAAVPIVFILLLHFFELFVYEVFEFIDQGLLLIFLETNYLTEALCITWIGPWADTGWFLVNTSELAVDVGESFNNLLPDTTLKPLIYLWPCLADSLQDVMLAWRTWKIIFFLFFPLQDVGGHEFDEFIVKNIENLAAYNVKFGLLSGQVILKHLD